MELNVTTKFNVGDLVYIKQDLERWKRVPKDQARWNGFSLNKCLIVEIVTVTCYAATQTSYRLRMYNENGSVYENFNEIELTNEVIE